MKKIALILSCFISTLIFSQSYPVYNGTLINDFANVIPNEQEQALLEKAKAYENQTSIQIVIVTVNTLNNDDVSHYTNQLFRKWGVGQAGLNNGLMILVAPNERKWRIEIGYGLEQYITDGSSKEAAEKFFPSNFKNNDYYTGINLILDDFINKLGSDAWKQREEFALLQKNKAKAEADNLTTIFLWVLFSGAVIFLFIFFIRRKIKAQKEEFERIIRYGKEVQKKEYAEKKMRESINAELISIESDYKVILTKVEKLVREKFYQSEVILDVLKTKTQVSIGALKTVSLDIMSTIISDKIMSDINNVREGMNFVPVALFSNYDYKNKIEKQHLQIDSNIESMRSNIVKAKTAVEKLKASYSKNDLSKISLNFEEVCERNLTSAKEFSEKTNSLLKTNNFPQAIENYKNIQLCFERANKSVEDVFVIERDLFSTTASIKSSMKEYPALIQRTRSVVKGTDVETSTRREFDDLVERFNYLPEKVANPASIIAVSTLITELINDLNTVRNKASNDTVEAERNRKRKKDDEEAADRRRSSDISSYSSESYSTSTSSSGSDFGSSMGGGDSGGGGSSGDF